MYNEIYQEDKGDFAFHLFFKEEFDIGIPMLLCDVNLIEEFCLIVFVAEPKDGFGIDYSNAIGIKIGDTVETISKLQENNHVVLKAIPWLRKNKTTLLKIHEAFVNEEDYEEYFDDLMDLNEKEGV